MSFLPIFTLESQEGRLVRGRSPSPRPFAMAAGRTVVDYPGAGIDDLVRPGPHSSGTHRNPLNRLLIWMYRPVIAGVLKAKSLTILAAVVILGVTAWPVQHIGSEFMPNLDEGTLMYMPTTLPGLSVTKAAELMQTQDRIIKSFPEVETVFGKAGRALTATDPAPTEMFETIITLKPRSEWRPGVTSDSLKQEMDAALQFPGVSNAWTMPIRARIEYAVHGDQDAPSA